VHEPGVGALLKRIGEQQLTNVRILAHDAVEVLAPYADRPATLDGMHIFFPDPWHKKKHHKRRLIQPPLVAKLADAPQTRRLPALCHRLAALRRTDAGRAQRRADAGEHSRCVAGQLCAQAGLTGR
jgi:hypothetical protein